MKHLMFIFFLTDFMAIAMIAQKNEATISPDALSSLLGSWEGSLTYVDYTSGNPFTMPANLDIEEGKNAYELTLNNVFPNEPNANNSVKLKISRDGRQIGGKSIVEKRKTDTGGTAYVVEYDGRDGNDNQKALIRETYVIGKEEFRTFKEVRFDGTDQWIKRNEFSYTRK